MGSLDDVLSAEVSAVEVVDYVVWAVSEWAEWVWTDVSGCLAHEALPSFGGTDSGLSHEPVEPSCV